MPTLRELQSTVMQALLGTSTEPALALLDARAERAAAQLRIYRSTAEANFTDSLRSSYPVIARLVGEEYFRQIARELQRRHPSRSGDLLWIGQTFAAYLAELHAENEYRYLADVARFEWLCQEALLAPGHEPLSLTKLAAAAGSHHALVFLTHPTLRYFESTFPVLRIWESNLAPLDREPETVDLASGPDRLLLLRRALALQFHRLNHGEQLFLAGLSDQSPFGTIVEACVEADPRFDATETLQRFVSIGAIVGFRL